MTDWKVVGGNMIQQSEILVASCNTMKALSMHSEGISSIRMDFEGILSNEGNLTLDLSGIDTMDGSGVGALAFLHKRLTARGDSLRIVGARGQPLNLLRELGIDDVIEMDSI